MDSVKNPAASEREAVSGRIGSGRRKVVEVKLEIYEEGGKIKHLKGNMAVMDRRGSGVLLTTLPELSDGRPSAEITATEFSLSPTEILESESTSLKSSNSSDLFQVDTNLINQSETRKISLNSHHGIKLEFKDDESDSSSTNSSKSGKSNGSPGAKSASQVSDATHESAITYQSPTQSPPIQKMDRLEGYDPYRIPSSVFERSKSTTPLEWSVASNESLFSIHVGNNSFSREQALMLGDLAKSGDWTKLEEPNVSNPPPAIITSTESGNCMELEKELKMEDIADCSSWETEGLIAEDVSERKVPPVISWDSSNVTGRSDGSGGSTDSFAFPIKKKRSCASFYCSNCSWAFCYYIWPSCYLTWPSCYCWKCSRAFCYCWNCSRKRLCCHSPNILADEVQSESVAADAKKKHQDTVGSALSSKSRKKSWFPCCYPFPSCSCSCCSCCTWGRCGHCSNCFHPPLCCGCPPLCCGCPLLCSDCPRCRFRNCCHFQNCCQFYNCQWFRRCSRCHSCC